MNRVKCHICRAAPQPVAPTIHKSGKGTFGYDTANYILQERVLGQSLC